MEAVPLIISALGAGASIFRGAQQQKAMEKASSQQQALLADQNAKLSAVEAGQRANRGGKRGLLAYVDEDQNKGLTDTLGAK